MASNSNQTGIAFGGGAVLGAAHVGVAKAFLEGGVVPGCVSGTSIGAFVAAHIAFGTPVNTLEEIARELDWLDITAFKFSKMGILTNERMGKNILDHFGKVQIEEADIPLSMIATDLCTGKKVVLDKGPLYKAVMASACLPGIFTPVEWDEMLLVDGVLSENVPVSPLIGRCADIIAIDLTSNREYKRPENVIDVLSNTFDIGLNNMVIEQLEDENIRWLRPSLSAYNMADTRQVEKLIDEGYKTGVAFLTEEAGR